MIYELENEKFIEYTEEDILTNEPTTYCEICGRYMEKIPVMQSYLRVDNGKILFNIDHNGKPKLIHTEPDWIWACSNNAQCSYAEIKPTSENIIPLSLPEPPVSL